MKQILILMMMVPLISLAQKDVGYGKFILADGSVMKGTSVTKLYERLVPLYTLQSNATANSTVIRFTLINEPATAVFRDILRTGARMRSGEIMLTYISMERLLVRYKINMEDVAVEECMDDNGNSTIQLHATRMGWTYYTYSKSGVQTVSSKSGWDERTRTAWTAF